MGSAQLIRWSSTFTPLTYDTSEFRTINPYGTRTASEMRKNMLNAMKGLIALALAFTAFGLSASDADAAAAALCSDGQVMQRQGSQPACICRPPLKYLPGNICGSGKAKTPTNTGTSKGVNAICEVGMVPEASGCRCQAPLKVLPGGRCGVPTAAGAACKEGESVKATHCKCKPPLMQSASGARNCIRCLPGDGDKVVNGRCRQNVKKR